MRNMQKKQIIKQINTLREACEELKRQQKQAFINLCADIQEFVAKVFGYVEDAAGTDSELAGLLKDFYEMLYRATREEVTVEQLQKNIHRMETVIAGLTPDKIEMAFFCYKASMSDSLESIYFAAKEDPACDAYFIPIPYFDKKTDGSLGQMHLEGVGCYSEGYELTDWSKYDIEVRCPDVAFIMNPYDDGNAVTSVHPDFFSKRLKEFCGALCYVPYFVCRHNIDFVASGKTGMWASSGFVFADYVFVQSEKVKQAYINAVHHVEAQCDNKMFDMLNKKLIALGSPKFDKVINSKPEDYTLPDEWTRLIGNKEVVVYNTTVAAILRHSERYLEKLHSVLLMFKSRTDVVLWWRPHPLMEQTLASLRPELVDEYQRIVRDYRNDGFGIYDDTSDLHRAITRSDRYYGDRSSLVMLYAATGKPVLISPINQRQYSERNNWNIVDVESNDLSDWLDKKEKWNMDKSFSNVFDYAFKNGDSGEHIYMYCKKAVKRI